MEVRLLSANNKPSINFQTGAIGCCLPNGRQQPMAPVLAD